MCRFVTRKLYLQIVGAALIGIRRRLVLRFGLMLFLLLVGARSRIFPFSSMQSIAHLAEQRAESLTGGLDRNVGLNLGENFENLGVHAMHQLLVRGGANRVSNR